MTIKEKAAPIECGAKRLLQFGSTSCSLAKGHDGKTHADSYRRKWTDKEALEAANLENE